MIRFSKTLVQTVQHVCKTNLTGMGKWMEVESVTRKKIIIGRNGQCFLVTIFNTPRW